MLNTHNFEDKTYELALQKCLDELKMTEEQLFIQTEETEAKLFKAKKVTIKVITVEEIKDYIKNFFESIAQYMKIEIHPEIREVDHIFRVNLVSDHNSILIGKDGRTINSLQIVLRQGLQSATNHVIKVNLDAGNYKEKKEKNFAYEIKKIMKEVSKTKVDVKLDPMNSYQRRIVHNLANEFDHIKTISSGEGMDRFITIKYQEDK